METIIAIIFIILAIALFLAEYIIETNKRKKLMSKKDWQEYIMNGLIIGQNGRAKMF